MKKLMIAVAVAAAFGATIAQEAEVAVTEETAEIAGAPAEGAVVCDEGVEVVEQIQAEETAPVAKFQNAKKVLQQLAESKGWNEGWDSAKGRMFVIESYSVDCKDPANDKDFFTKREMAAKAAVLKAKTQVIQWVNSELSGEELIDMPGSEVNKKLSAEREKVAAMCEAQRVAMLSLLEATDKAEAEMLQGTTLEQRMDDMLAALIKKLDETYDAGGHDEAARLRYESLKEQAEAAKKAYEKLCEEANKLQMEVKERHENTVQLAAKMPLFGMTVALQTESFNKEKGKYEVAVLGIWSKELERTSRAIATGEEFRCKPGKETVHAWLARQDLATMVGPRQFVDENGDRWFLGVTARLFDDDMPSIMQRRAKGLADSFARQMLAFSVMADVEIKETAAQAKETRGNDETAEYLDQIAEDYATKMTQKLEKKNIRGMQKLKSTEVEHPITGQGIYVTVWGLNSTAAKQALAIENINMATKIQSNRHQTEEAGRKAAYEAAERASKNRGDDFQRGAVKGTKALGAELNTRQPKKPAGIRVNQETSEPKPVRKATSQGGVFGGDVDVDDNF